MGCAVSGLQRTMSLFSRSSNNSQENRAVLERKLYLAKESPDPDFDLSDCQLRRLPPGIFLICKVFRKDFIYLHNNRLHTLEDGGQLSDLQLIKVLNLSNNQYSHLPNNIRYLVSLTELYLQNNNLESLPDGIKYLECLQVLDVSNNKLSCINSAVGNLKSLKVLKITANNKLNKLCPELCFAVNLVSIELNGDNFIYPPSEIATKGTKEIMKFLCLEMNVDYVQPTDTTAISPSQIPSANYNVFDKHVGTTWEQQEAKIVEQENKIHKANQIQREKFLSKFLKEQQNLDNEIAKVQEVRDIERQKLMKSIQKEEMDVECLVENFIQSDRLKPEVVQQQLAHEQAEHNRLLGITRQNYDNVRRTDILTAMEKLIENNYQMQYHKKNYKDDLNNIKQILLSQESEGTNKLVSILNAKDESRSILIKQVLEDQDIQKAIVSSLLDRVDAKCWSLNQEISLISMHLARLSVIEQEKKKMQLACNYNDLLTQRSKLVGLLDDLLDQRSKHRKQLIDILKAAEGDGSMCNDFWLKSYQKLLDSAPKCLFNIRKLDPIFANYLLQEGVIHCLPFLAKSLLNGESLSNITHENLKDRGVTLSSDRENILRALNLYMIEKTENSNNVETNSELTIPSAPSENKRICSGILNVDENESSNVEGECVICMDEKSEVVFVPCGHMCCCQTCAQSKLEGCPMCRTNIERVIKVIIT